MTYKIDWFTPNHVIEAVLPENADDAFILKLDNDLNTMLDTASQPVHIIMDTRGVKSYPSAPMAMKVKYYKHARLGRLVLLGLPSNPVVRFLSTLVGKTVGIQIKGFATREEAHAYLASVEHA